MRFKRKPQEIKHTNFVTITNAKALHIKRTGSYILMLDKDVPLEQLQKMQEILRKGTGAKWVIVQGGAKVVEDDTHN